MGTDNNTDTANATEGTESTEVDSSMDMSFLDGHLPEVNGVSGEQAAAFNSTGIPAEEEGGVDTADGVNPDAVTDTTGTTAEGDIEDVQPVTPASEQLAVDSDEAKRHQESMDAHKELITTLTAKNTPAVDEAPKSEEPEIPPYMFNIPDNLITAIGSDDPAEVKQGVQGLAAGIARSIHATMQQSLVSLVEGRLGGINETVVQTMQTRELSKTVFDDFYGKYEQFNKPELYPIIQQISTAMLKDADGKTKWDDALRDKIAAKASEVLGIPLEGVAATTQAITTPAKLGGGNNARPASKGLSANDQALADLLT